MSLKIKALLSINILMVSDSLAKELVKIVENKIEEEGESCNIIVMDEDANNPKDIDLIPKLMEEKHSQMAQESFIQKKRKEKRERWQ